MSDRFQFAVGDDRALLYVQPDAIQWVALKANQIVSVEEIGEKSAA